jgi:hypothetical protein
LDDWEAGRAIMLMLSHQLKNQLLIITSTMERRQFPYLPPETIAGMEQTAEKILSFLEVFGPERAQPFFLSDYVGDLIIATPQTHSYEDEYRRLAEEKSPKILSPVQVRKLDKQVDFAMIKSSLGPPAEKLKERIEQLQAALQSESGVLVETIVNLSNAVRDFKIAFGNVESRLTEGRAEMREVPGRQIPESHLRESGSLPPVLRSPHDSLAALHSVSDKLVVIDFRDMTDPRNPFSDEQTAEIFSLVDAAGGKVRVLIHDVDVSHDRYRELQALMGQMERRSRKLRGTITLRKESLGPDGQKDIPTDRRQVLHLFKNARDFSGPAAFAGPDRKVLKFRYEDETGQLTQAAGTLGYAVTIADEISEKTAGLLRAGEGIHESYRLPGGIRFNADGGYFTVDTEHAGLWGRIYGMMYAVAFARSA